MTPVRHAQGGLAEAARGAVDVAVQAEVCCLRGQRLCQIWTGRAHGRVQPLGLRLLQSRCAHAVCALATANLSQRVGIEVPVSKCLNLWLSWLPVS